MDEDGILALYEWATGTCFRCASEDVDTTHVKTLQPQSGPTQDVRACRHCVVVLETEREVAAARAGHEYVPGLLGS
jgi:hypothetical protein